MVSKYSLLVLAVGGIVVNGQGGGGPGGGGPGGGGPGGGGPGGGGPGGQQCVPCQTVTEGPLAGDYNLAVGEVSDQCTCVYDGPGNGKYCLEADGLYNTVQCPTTTAAPITAVSAGPTDANGDDALTRLVKGYIDAGTCTTNIQATSNCGEAATSYYREFEYNGKRVIIASQVPDHPAEHDMLMANPNQRCERWQFIQLPLNPTKGSSSTRTGLGTIGLAVTGAAFYNDLSSPISQGGTLAMPNEGPTLDSCFGHSARAGAYHYHANPNCTDAGAATGSADPDQCKLIGYYRDGVPVYGFCKTTSGIVMRSCFKLKAGVTTVSVSTVGGDYSNLGSNYDDYEFDAAALAAGSCDLDEANGAVHPTTGVYSYFATTTYPFLPIYYYGAEGEASFCAAY